MSQKQRREKKKHKRELLGKKRAAGRRNALRKKASWAKKTDRMVKKYEIKPVPIRKGMTPFDAEHSAAKDEIIKKRLEHNMEILKALEEQMKQEEAARAETAPPTVEQEIAEITEDQACVKLPSTSTGTIPATFEIVSD